MSYFNLKAGLFIIYPLNRVLYVCAIKAVDSMDVAH